MNDTWLAIHREALLAGEHLAAGATMLGKANYAHQSRYYQAFFALSVGLERSAKLALAIEKYLDTGSFPVEKELRAYGHNLDELLANMDALARRRGLTEDWSFLPSSDISTAMIRVLSDFASNITRYYNLDTLTQAARIQGVVDPLQAWHDNVFVPVSRLHYGDKRRAKVAANAEAVALMLGGVASVHHVSETGDVLTDIKAASALTGMTKAIQPWVRMYVLQFARFVYEVMSDLGYAVVQDGRQDVPYLSDYFAIFCNDDSYFRSRRTWSIHPT